MNVIKILYTAFRSGTKNNTKRNNLLDALVRKINIVRLFLEDFNYGAL